MKVAILALFLIVAVFAARDEDLMQSSLPNCPSTSFNQYSGYLNVTDEKRFHYVMSESQNNPETDPVIFWFNGGPGCSSMIGFIQEHGPCVFLEDSDHEPSENPHSWNKFANMVYLESPAGVGYNHFTGRFDYDDENVSYENLKAVEEFFTAFPEKRNNELYLSGESYGGIYIPYLALRIDEYNQNSTNSEKINLKGFMIGNGVTNWKYDTAPAFVKMGWTHGLISKALNEQIINADCDFADVGAPPQTRECERLFSEFQDSTKHVYPYDIYRPPEDFYSQTPAKSVEELLTSDNEQAASYISFSKLFKNSKRNSNDFAPVNKFMNNADTKKAMNIPEQYNWSECNNISYEMLEKATQWIYPLLKGKYRMMHYSGDTDGVVPTVGTEGWMEDLGWEITSPYTAWLSQPKLLGGYTQTREGGLDFVTVHGCGHMAPQWKRQPSYLAISSWVNGKDLPRE